MTAWSGLTGLGAVLEELRPSLVTFRDEQGAELFDLPSAPRPGADVPAPVRLAAEFDNLLLSHADRSRVVSAENLKRFYTINGVFPGSVLIDGFVAGMWRLARNKSAATLTIELFGPPGERDQVAGRPSACSRSARQARPTTSVSPPSPDPAGPARVREPLADLLGDNW